LGSAAAADLITSAIKSTAARLKERRERACDRQTDGTRFIRAI